MTWSGIGKSSYNEQNTTIQKVEIGSDVTSIGDNAFNYCGSLISVTIPYSVTSIGDYAFLLCDSLTSIIIGNSVTSIGEGAFRNTKISDFILPDSVQSIKYGAFSKLWIALSIVNVYTTKQYVADLITNSQFSYSVSQALTINVYLNNELYKTFQHAASCFPVGTKITLADSSKKNVEDIVYSDILKVFDFDEGKDSSAPICWLTKKGLKNDHFYRLTFSDGTVLRTTGTNSNHKVYNVDERYFKGVDKTEIGDRIQSENGIVTVTNKEYVEEEVEYYNIITSKKINCYADGILTSDRYGNLYPIDENMKYIKEGRETRPYSPEFEEAGVTEYWYENLRLGESTDDMDTIKEYIAKCEGQMRPLDE